MKFLIILAEICVRIQERTEERENTSSWIRWRDLELTFTCWGLSKNTKIIALNRLEH